MTCTAEPVTQIKSSPNLSQRLQGYILLVFISGLALMVYLMLGVEWSPSVGVEMGVFTLLIVAAGSFPLSVAPRVKADVTSAPLFAAALLLEPGVASLAGVLGLTSYTLLNRFWGQRLALPWYKYPFNAGQVALYVGLTSVVFHSLAPDGSLLGPAVALAVGVYYLVNTGLVSAAVGLQLAVNPFRFWWNGTRENGLSELSLFAFGLLAAVLYEANPWAIATVLIPVAVIYVAFSSLARRLLERETTERELEKAKEELEIRVDLRTVELKGTNDQLGLSRRRVVRAQEELRKSVAQQLHGPVQNRLLVATHWLREAQTELGENPGKCSENLANATRLIEEINHGELRTAMKRLHPSLIRISLIAADLPPIVVPQVMRHW